jgi:hypothetical protein
MEPSGRRDFFRRWTYACIHVVIRGAIAAALVDRQLGSQEFDEGAHSRNEAAAGWEYGVKPMCCQATIGQEMDEPSVLDRRASQIHGTCATPTPASAIYPRDDRAAPA